MKVIAIHDEMSRSQIVKIKNISIKNRIKLLIFGEIEIPYHKLKMCGEKTKQDNKLANK